jgi:hypothetical protein
MPARVHQPLTFPTVTAEEVREKGLEEDPLAHIRIRGVERKAVRKAWKAYRRQRKEYLSHANKADDPPSEDRASKE